ncbi:MAG TPA: dienelactone hydrolase family protein [Solirubrobacteraceae bacterium]|nr:dienelactone hydrolase family protein [Solirubrobacteraceae bacterium]
MSLKALVTGGLAVLAVAVPSSPALAQFQRGPNPTVASLQATTGPYATSTLAVADSVSTGFGAANVTYPTTTADGTFGAVAISPGFTESESAVAWLRPRLASHGFVVITFNTNSGSDQPASRGDQLLAALDWLTTSSSVKSRIDASRLAVMGHSMGGGGALEAAKDRPALQAVVGLTPWNSDKTWPEIVTPSLMIGAQNDNVAPVASHAIPFYNGLPASLQKAYLELAGASHFVTNSPNDDRRDERRLAQALRRRRHALLAVPVPEPVRGDERLGLRVQLHLPVLR